MQKVVGGYLALTGFIRGDILTLPMEVTQQNLLYGSRAKADVF